MTYAPEDLDCPDAAACPVAVAELSTAAHALGTTSGLQVCTSPAGTAWFRVYLADDGFALPNPGFGDTRFAPFDDAGGQRVSAMYLAETLEGALLETVLRNIGTPTPRVVSESDLLGKLQVKMVAPRDLALADLRDPALDVLDVERDAVSASPAEHYPCTRSVAKAIHGARTPDGSAVDGVVWHSRQAELSGRDPQEVAVLFAPTAPLGRGSWRLAEARGANGALLEGDGRAEFDRVSHELGITVMRDLPVS